MTTETTVATATRIDPDCAMCYWGEAYGLPIVTEIVSSDHIPVMRDYVDVLQIGARNMQNFELLKKVGALGKPVILKRGLSATIA